MEWVLNACIHFNYNQPKNEYTSPYIQRAGFLIGAKRRQFFVGNSLYSKFSDQTLHYILELCTFVDKNLYQARFREIRLVLKIQHTELVKFIGRSW